MAIQNGQGDVSPSWFVVPADTDLLAWLSFALLLLALYAIVTLYAAFDRWAEHKSKGTPLAKTIPTLLAIALLYEIFPLGHFNILLPISAILVALMADWSRFNQRGNREHESEIDILSETDAAEPTDDSGRDAEIGLEEAKNV